MTKIEEKLADFTNWTVLKSINDLEALVRYGSGGLRLAYLSGDEVTMTGPPADRHVYVVKAEVGMDIFASHYTVGYTEDSAEGVVTVYVNTVPEKYAQYGDLLTAPTEAELEALPGVLKAIKTHVHKIGTRWTLKDGELYAG